MAPAPTVQRAATHWEAGSDARALVFLHGIGGSARAWLGQLDVFAPRYRAVAWNAPGYGGAPLVEPYDWAGLSAALLRRLDALDIGTIALVGHSMGGMIAQDFVARYPQRVHALVLAGTSPAFGRPDGEFQQRFVSERLAPLEAGRTMADLAPALVAGMVGDHPSPAGVAEAVSCMSEVPPETYRAALRNLVTFDGREHLPRIAVPCLVLAFEKDGNAPAPMMEKMAARIPGAAYRCIPGAGHLANLEQPLAFDAILGEFLDEVAVRCPWP